MRNLYILSLYSDLLKSLLSGDAIWLISDSEADTFCYIHASMIGYLNDNDREEADSL